MLDVPSFAAIAAVICVQSTVENSLETGVNRLIGTLIGGIFSLIIIVKVVFNLICLTTGNRPPSYPLLNEKELIHQLLMWSEFCLLFTVGTVIMSSIDLGFDKRRNINNKYGKLFIIINITFTLMFIVFVFILLNRKF